MKWSVVLLLALLILYLSTSARTMTGFGDSDELITAGYTLSLAHPPGYPLLTLFLFGATHIPFVSPGVGAHGLAAVIMTLTMMQLYWIGSHYAKRVDPSVVAILTFLVALTGLIWQHATYIEPFGLSGLLSLLMARFLISNQFGLAAMVAGFGMANHQTFIIPLLILGVPMWRHWWRMVLWFSLSYGLLYLIYLHGSPLSWQLQPGFTGLWKFYSRADFGGFIPGSGMVSAWWSGISVTRSLESLGFFFSEMWRNWNLLIIVGAAGIVTSWKKQLPVVIIWFILGPVLAAYLTLPPAVFGSIDYETSRAILTRMYLLADIWFGLLVIFGGVWLAKRVRFFVPIGAILIATLMVYRFPFYNLSGYRSAEAYATALMTSLPPTSRLLCLSDLSCFGASYVQTVLGLRSDVIIVSDAAQFHRSLIEAQSDLWRFRYPDNPFRLGELVGWSMVRNHPVFVSELNAYWANELGLQGEAFWLVPSTYSMQIVSTPPLQVVDPEPVLNFDQKLLSTHGYIGVLKAVTTEQAALNQYLMQPQVAKVPTTCLKTKSEACELWLTRFAAWRQPDNVWARVDFARTFESADLLPLAKREYRHTLELDSQNVEAKTALERLNNVEDLGEL